MVVPQKFYRPINVVSAVTCVGTVAYFVLLSDFGSEEHVFSGIRRWSNSRWNNWKYFLSHDDIQVLKNKFPSHFESSKNDSKF